MSTAFAEEIKERLEPIRQGSTDLDAYADALGEMFREVEELAREDADGNLPWSSITDPELALTTSALLWLAQLAGVRPPIGLAADDLRTFIELAESRRRGTIAYMVEIVQRQLTGTKTVVVTERVGDNAYLLDFATRTDETPHPAATEAALREVKPAGIVLDFNDVSGYKWNESIHGWNAAGAVTWDESVDTLP